MLNKRFANLGRAGLIADPAPSLAPEDSVTDGRDFLTDGVGCYRAPGTIKLFDLDIKPLKQFIWRDENRDLRIIVSDLSLVYMYKEDGTYIDVSPIQPLTSSAKLTWTVLNGVLVMNSSVDGPFFCDPSDNYRFVLLQTGLTFRAVAMVAFRYNLVALGITDGGNYYPHKIMWSVSAADGQLPTDWVPTELNDAGDDLVGETPGVLVGAVQVQDTLYVIKDDGIYTMRWIGLPYVFQIQRIKGQIGVLTPRLAVEARGLLMLAPLSDILGFDGSRATSLANGRVRQFLDAWTKDIDPENCQLVYELARQHLMLGVPEPVAAGETRMSNGWIYSTLNDTWGHKALSHAYGLATGRIGNDSSESLVVFESNAEDTEWWVAYLGETVFDEEQESFVERTGLQILANGQRVRITRVYPEVRGTAETVQLAIGTQETANSEIRWGPTFDVNPSEERSFGVNISGRFLAYRLDYAGIEAWKLDALTLKGDSDGER